LVDFDSSRLDSGRARFWVGGLGRCSSLAVEIFDAAFFYGLVSFAGSCKVEVLLLSSKVRLTKLEWTGACTVFDLTVVIGITFASSGSLASENDSSPLDLSDWLSIR
jgi:hypothetical protein